ncbi:hypothetical protein KAR91_47805 [Candidatus Pacearchaeota archaeon]|nr:hypothetical protein [Candidatus Pacearchaeota archaeon]
MKNQDIYKKGTELTLEGGAIVVVAGYKKGWYTAKDGMKFRASKITEANYDEDDEEGGKMSKTLSKYAEGYEPSLCASGRKSLNTGDKIAHLLAGLEPLAVIQAAESVLGLEDGELLERYEHLNNGQQRMNAGNLIRSAFKRGEVTVTAVKKAIH